MDQFNRNVYKKETLFEQFYHSCLGKLIILAGILFILFLIAIVTVPSDEEMNYEMDDAIRECLFDPEPDKNDILDETVSNLSHIFTEADSMQMNKELLAAYLKYNTYAVHSHLGYKTVLLHNNMHPQGIRIGIGIFGYVIPTLRYQDMVLSTGPVRSDYNKRLGGQPIIDTLSLHDPIMGDNPALKPYHYQGDPEN